MNGVSIQRRLLWLVKADPEGAAKSRLLLSCELGNGSTKSSCEALLSATLSSRFIVAVIIQFGLNV